MGRPVVTKGDIQRVIAAAVAEGMKLGEFEVRVEGAAVRVLPCLPVRPQGDVRPNSMDALLGT